MAFKQCSWFEQVSQSASMFALFDLKILLNTTQKVKCLKNFNHLLKPVGYTQSTLVGHVVVMLKDLPYTILQSVLRHYGFENPGKTGRALQTFT